MAFRLTRNHKAEFDRCFNQLSVGKQGTKVDVTLKRAHWELLHPLPIEAVLAAAEELKRTPGPFLSDPGTWFRMADTLAAQMLHDQANETARRLTAPESLEREEEDQIREARAEAVAHVEEYLGRPLKPHHPWVSGEIRVPTYGCTVCKDTGFRTLPPSEEERRYYGEAGGWGTVERCVCWETNPVLLRERTGWRVNDTRKQRV